MTKKAKIRTDDNEIVSFVLRDDGRVFYSPDMFVAEKKKTIPIYWYLFGALELQFIVLLLLDIFKVI